MHADLGSPGLPVVTFAVLPGEPFSFLSLQTSDGRTLSFHSRRDPIGEAERLLDLALKDGDPGCLVVIGLGLGFLIDALERRQSVTRVLAIEPFGSPAARTSRASDFARWQGSGRLRVLDGPEYRGSDDAWRQWPADDVTTEVVVHPVLAREFPDTVASCRVLANSILSGIRGNNEARRRFAGAYLLNTLQNLDALARSGDVDALSGQFSRVPAIVVAAGPSLDANLPAIRRLQNQALIVAADTAARPLLSAGVMPDFVVAVDPQELNGRHLCGLPPHPQTWLVAEGSIDPSVFSQFGDQVFVFSVSEHQPWPWLQSHGFRRGRLRAWGSVITTTFDLVCRMDCSPVIFAGADLAYSGGMTYCRNTTYEPRWSTCEDDGARKSAMAADIAGRTTVETVDIRGQVVLTTPSFLQFRDWLLRRAEAEPGRRVLNGTGRGTLGGPAIELVDLETLSLDGTRAKAPDLQEVIRRGWSGSLPHMTPIDPRQAPTEVWLDFARNTLSEREIVRCLPGAPTLVDRIQFVASQPPSSRRRIPRVAAVENVGPCTRVAPWDSEHAVVTPRGAVGSVLVSSDGTVSPLSTWPVPIVGELPWGSTGGSVAWTPGPHPVLLSRRTGGGEILEEVLPFVPARPCVVDGDELLCPTYHDGLWTWRPGVGGRCVAQTGMMLSARPENGGYRLDPIKLDAGGFVVRSRAGYALRFNGQDGELVRVPLGPEGPCWSSACSGSLAAHAFPHANLVRVSVDGDTVWEITAYYPLNGVAWAGSTLLVANVDGILVRIDGIVP